MLRHHFLIAIRNLWKSKFYSLLNILGLALGMAVALIIFMWLADELSYNHYHHQYQQIGVIQKNRTYNGQIFTETSNPVPLGKQLRESYSNYFDEVVVSSYGGERILQYGEKSTVRRGYFMEEGGNEILDLKLIRGSVQFPLDPSSLLISQSLSQSLFGDEDPIGKMISIDNNVDVQIAGVYEDIPRNSTFRSVAFYGSFKLFGRMQEWVRNSMDNWHENSFPIYVKLKPGTDPVKVSSIIKDVTYNITHDESRSELFIYPMSKWHLYPEFKNGKMVATGMQNIWLFGSIGLFVLLLAIINFMNLSTARSEKRAKEIGIKKAVGSQRKQLINQFLTESCLTSFFAMIFGVVIVQLALPTFNVIAEKNMEIQWNSPTFWTSIIIFGWVTGFLAGSYPAFYMSATQPMRVLKGLTKSGKRGVLPRKILVVLQFSISTAMIITTLIVYQQIQLGKERPAGFQHQGLVQMIKRSSNLQGRTDVIRQELRNSGAVAEVAEANGPVTEMWHMNHGFQWKGKDPAFMEEFVTLSVSPEFGQTVRWNITHGRNFSRELSSDTSAMVLNQAAVDMMGLENPVDEVVRWNDRDYIVVGVVQNLLMESPFASVRPTVFTMQLRNMPFVIMRLNPALSVHKAVADIKDVFEKINPGGVLNLNFVDQEFNLKFWREERMGQLSAIFSGLAIFISLIGIFGLSAFMAEQKTKEIGIRKVLGANILHISKNMSGEFLLLVSLSFLIAFPTAHFFMENWLEKYEMRVPLSIWIFFATGGGILFITLITIGFQAVKAASVNPTVSLKQE